MRLSRSTQYRLTLVGVLVLFCYILTAEVVPRWREVLGGYQKLRSRQSRITDTLKLTEKRVSLLAQKKQLASLIAKDDGGYEQSQTGVFNFLSRNASTLGVRLVTLTPIEPGSKGEITEAPFKATLSGDYHRIGRFVNAIETGPMRLRMQSLSLQPSQVSKYVVEGQLEGIVLINPRERAQ